MVPNDLCAGENDSEVGALVASPAVADHPFSF